MKQDQPALSRRTRRVENKKKKQKKNKKQNSLPLLTSLFSCIFSLIAIAIPQTQTPPKNKIS
jgi:hypothetical protein